MKTVIISTIELVELSEQESIEIYCEICKVNTLHKPMKQIGKGTSTKEVLEDGTEIEIEDVEDAYIVACTKCGNYVIAKRGKELISPPT